MELSVILPHVEALIFASDKPLAEEEIEEYVNRALAFMEDRTHPDQIVEALNTIQEKYQSEFYSFEVVKSGGGWQFLSKKEYHPTISLLYGDKFLKKLSVTALETLAIIAYEQPVTKSEIELIRGVNCDYAVQKLLEKELVVIAGRKEDSPGKPLIYTTSKAFMDYFGINDSDDLPKIQEILSNEILEATKMLHSSLNTEEQENTEVNIEQETISEESEDIATEEQEEVNEEGKEKNT